jgi:hypothetical protein
LVQNGSQPLPRSSEVFITQASLDSLQDLPESISDELHKLERIQDWSGIESPLPSNDDLFAQYLRSRSPSCSPAHSINGHRDCDVTSSGTHVGVHRDVPSVDMINQNTAKLDSIPVKVNTPRIILRVSQPKPTPKVLLRLN